MYRYFLPEDNRNFHILYEPHPKQNRLIQHLLYNVPWPNYSQHQIDQKQNYLLRFERKQKKPERYFLRNETNRSLKHLTNFKQDVIVTTNLKVITRQNEWQ